MEYVRLGKSGLKVSRICLGCMSYGVPTAGPHPWILDEERSRPFIKQALESGINFFDLANNYGDGTSEEVVGRILKDFAKREEIVISSKVYMPVRKGPNGGGLSRKSIMTEIDASLKRIGTDYLDIYQIHRWDYHTPIEETLEALHDLVKAGKVRYLGASSMFAYQFAKLLSTADRRRWTRFVIMQNYYNLLYREEEREMLPLCADEGIGVTPWSPLARGRLARPPGETSARAASDWYAKKRLLNAEDADQLVIERVVDVAKARGVSMGQIGLAWLLSKPVVTAPVVGATKLEHLNDAIAAASLKLSKEEIAALEERYIPHAVVGFD